ncbi:MAG: ATP F0F1 synthase subunit B [Pseudomonadota bacterium]
MHTVLDDSNFVVGLAFVGFAAVLLWFEVPAMLAKALDARAARIQGELDEARRIREEAQSLLASYERKQKEVEGQAQDIVAHARSEAELAKDQALKDLDVAIARRLKAAEDQIAAAEADAVRAVRDEAVKVAVAAAQDAIAEGLSKAGRSKLIDDGIEATAAKLH